MLHNAAEYERENEFDRLITQMTELKASQFRMDKDFRVKLKTVQKEHEAKVESIQQRLKASQKEVAALTAKAKGRQTVATAAAAANAAPPPPTVILSSGRRSSSSSDSPGTSWTSIVPEEETSSCYLKY